VRRGGGLWAKPYGNSSEVVLGTTLGEHIGNPLGNLKGTCWEQRKNEKEIPQFSQVKRLGSFFPKGIKGVVVGKV
jgi:hypothetical protein